MDAVGVACGLWLTGWLFQGGFVGSSSGFVVPQNGFIGRTPELRPPLEETRDNDEDVMSAYRETGEGWQTRINADLRRARKPSVRTATAPRNARRAPVATRSKANLACETHDPLHSQLSLPR